MNFYNFNPNSTSSRHQEYVKKFEESIKDIPELIPCPKQIICMKKVMGDLYCECLCTECIAGEQFFKGHQFREPELKAPAVNPCNNPRSPSPDLAFNIWSEPSPYGYWVPIPQNSEITSSSAPNKVVPSEKKYFKCDHCSKCFTVKHQLAIHMRVHTGERPYTCDICSMAFSHKCNMKSHKRTHSGEKSFQCEQCGKWFATKSNLGIHLAGKKHQEKYAQPKTSQLNSQSNLESSSTSCYVSLEHDVPNILSNSEQIKSKQVVKERKRKNVQPIQRTLNVKKVRLNYLFHDCSNRAIKKKCEKCGKGFKRDHFLRKHLKRCNGLRAYRCEHCPMSYHKKFQLNKHNERKHKLHLEQETL